jgi:glutamate-1-semialdehyde 2,1-aminomutase
MDEVTLVPFGDLEAAREALSSPGSDIAAVFVEPVLCNSGVLVPPAGYLEGLRTLCDETGALLVFDEVITGFRIANGGAVERYGVRPDLVVLAKALAGGYPLSAVAGRAAVIDLVSAGVVHAGTYNGNPIVLAAGLATMSVLAEPGVYQAFEARGSELAQGFRSAMQRAGVPGWVNQVGPVVQCSFGPGQGTDFTDFLAADQEFYERLVVNLLRRGVFALPGGRWYLSTAHSAADVAEAVAVFDAALAATLVDGAPPRMPVGAAHE